MIKWGLLLDKNLNVKICLVSHLLDKAFITPLDNLQNVLKIYSNRYPIILVVNENKIEHNNSDNETFYLLYKKSPSYLIQVLRHIFLNLRISWLILTLSKDVGVFVFFIEEGPLVPIFMAKIKRKKCMWILPSSLQKMSEHHRDISTNLLIHAQFVCFLMVDNIILYSQNIIKDWGLEQFRDKIIILNRHFVNVSHFKIIKEYSSRKKSIGYIGRLSKEKGILNFVYSLPRIIDINKELKISICGEGPLKHDIEKFINDNNLKNNVTIKGWLTFNDLPEEYNNHILLILPSYTEGLPNVMLESMACGTPVLATAVGGIPDIIQNMKNGFILNNNSPEDICKKVIEIIDLKNNSEVSMNARQFIERNFTFESIIQKNLKLRHFFEKISY